MEAEVVKPPNNNELNDTRGEDKQVPQREIKKVDGS